MECASCYIGLVQESVWDSEILCLQGEKAGTLIMVVAVSYRLTDLQMSKPPQNNKHMSHQTRRSKDNILTHSPHPQPDNVIQPTWGSMKVRKFSSPLSSVVTPS